MKGGIKLKEIIGSDFAQSNLERDLDIKLEHSYQQSINGEGRSYNAVFDDIEDSLK
ncbi:MAG: hypothetical protein J6E46_06135 [Faecalicoccus sp.]|nr:hypothetical protein [Faecalicoccus sp.]